MQNIENNIVIIPMPSINFIRCVQDFVIIIPHKMNNAISAINRYTNQFVCAKDILLHRNMIWLMKNIRFASV